MMRAWLTVLVCGGILTGPTVVVADSDFYESLDEVDVGRVFLSPEQRARLDARRGEAPAALASTPTGSTAAKTEQQSAAGYISSSSGRTRVWSDGGFVKGKEVSSVRFPGEVPISRKATAESDDDGT